MKTQDIPNVGEVPSENAKRDAIHVAVIPLMAAEMLRPGEHVGLCESGNAAELGREKRVGIVDPFRFGPVGKGERFWLFLYPGTVTSLRHVWSHPEFNVKVPDEQQRAESV